MTIREAIAQLLEVENERLEQGMYVCVRVHFSNLTPLVARSLQERYVMYWHGTGGIRFSMVLSACHFVEY